MAKRDSRAGGGRSRPEFGAGRGGGAGKQRGLDHSRARRRGDPTAADDGRPNWEPKAKPGRADKPAAAGSSGRTPAPRGADRRPNKVAGAGQDAPGAGRGRAEQESTEKVEPLVIGDDVVHARLTGAQAYQPVAGTGFAELGLGDNIIRELARQGAVTPFPIQAATIPDVLAGRDVLGRGRTGSGKTLAFGSAIVERLLRLRRADGAGARVVGRPPRAIVLAPTRELAQQLDDVIQPLARCVGLFTISAVGGTVKSRQVTGLSRGVDIVIGTPGRIEDLIEQRVLDLRQIEITVIDEADHMSQLGFIEPVERILRRTPKNGQRLLYSATLDAEVEGLVRQFLHDPRVHEVAGEEQGANHLDHRVLVIDPRRKRDVVTELVATSPRAIVFVRTRTFAQQLTEHLVGAGVSAVALHGDLEQPQRNRALAEFHEGRARVLVATDVAARGIHVDDVQLVVHADTPDGHKAYLHRSGRTGRAGAGGTVVTIVGPSRRDELEKLLERAGVTPTVTNASGRGR